MSSLARYGKSAADRTYPDADESVLGHMVLELGMSPEEAVQSLRPWVRDLDRSATTSKTVCYGTSAIGAGVGLLVGATMGVGLVAALPIVAAGYGFLLAQQSAHEQSTREAEYLLLKSCPELVKLIYALTKRGLPKEALIECYDELLGNFTAQYQTRAVLGVSEELDHDIVRSFQEIVNRKCEAENLGRQIVAEAQDFRFDTLYQSSEPTSPRVEAPKYQPSPQTQLGAVEVPSLNLGDDRKAFDWNRLNTEYNDFPHLFLLGKTGSGKSYLADRLVRFLDGFSLVITPKRMPSDFQGLQVVGLPYDYRAIHRAMVGLETLMKEREAEMQRTGKTDFAPVNVILDELPVSSAGCRDEGLDLLKPLKGIIRAGRTSKIRLIILAQGAEVKALGIEGEGGLRDSLSWVYLKGFAEEFARHKRIDIAGLDRPCIIDGQVADVSQLEPFASVQPPSLSLEKADPKVDSNRERLERMLQLPTADHEVVEDVTESSSSTAEIQAAFPKWNQGSLDVASLVIDWLRRKSEESYRPSDIRSAHRKLKDDPKLTSDRLKNLLDLLAQKGLITEAEGKYSAQSSITNDYDF